MLNEPVLAADEGNHFKLSLAPIEVLFFVGKIGFDDVEGGGIVAQFADETVEQFHATLLLREVEFHIFHGIFDKWHSFAWCDDHFSAKVVDAVDEFFHPTHLFCVVSGVFVGKFGETEGREVLALHEVSEGTVGKMSDEELKCVDSFLSVHKLWCYNVSLFAMLRQKCEPWERSGEVGERMVESSGRNGNEFGE